MSSLTNNKNWTLFLVLSVLIGAVLRLSFPGDIEYKDDERYMFEATQSIGVTQPWPELGMLSGGQVKNPGMSVWVFVALARLTHATNPIELARAVQLLNILGLILLAFFALRIVPEKERIYWTWATVLASVSPVALLFQRKIWAQSTLPFFCVLLWMAWHYRKERPGAFFWGFVGVCLGQIHLSGFYLAAGLFLWTFFHDRVARWGYWFAGSLIGIIPMFPWVKYVLSNAGNSAGFLKLFWLIYPKYWIFWVTDALGLGLTHSLKSQGFLDFLRYPVIGGTPTYLVGLVHAILILVVVRLLMLGQRDAAGRYWKMSDGTETGLLLNSLFIATGVLMTLSCFKINQHYLLMTFPLEWVWLSWMGLRAPKVGERYLALIWAVQLFISAAFLVYIHVNHGVPAGDYGTAFQYQTP